MFEIHDTHEAPQCGVEVIRFDGWEELDEFLDSNREVELRIVRGYAHIVER